VLVEGRDYTVSYKNNKAVAPKDLLNKKNQLIAPQIIVKGKGKYKNSVVLPFAIVPQNLANYTADVGFGSIDVSDKVVSKAANGYMKPSVTITDFDGKKLKPGTDFEIADYTVMDAEGNIIGISKLTDKTPIRAEAGYIITANIKAKGSSYTGTVKARYRYIAAASQLGKVKTVKLSDKVYTGYEVKLSAEDLTEKLYITEGGVRKYLVTGRDFEVLCYSSNVKKGTAKVTLKGKAPDFGGTKTLTFKITAAAGSVRGALIDGNWKN
jgi:hypothetical protein